MALRKDAERTASHFSTGLFIVMSTAGHSQEFVEAQTGVAQSSISKVLNGTDPSYVTLLALIRFYPKLIDAVKADASTTRIGVP